MTEAIKFPGTEMEVIEKYPLSRRLDHLDFADVCKTTFAKGVITDFEKISDDPIAVKSRVKVTGDFGESDYIPIFYHPKAKYWDGPTGPPIISGYDVVGWGSPSILATDYNEEGGYFEKAWMSFRCGDEVAVMLKEGKPVAVIGFADGKPRIGENVLKVEVGAGYWYNALIAAVHGGKQTYAGKDQGPDGLALGLSYECEHITLKPHVATAEYEFSDGWEFNWNYVGRSELVYVPYEDEGGFYFFPYEGYYFYQSGTQETKTFYSKSITEFKEYAYLVKIGPILFWIDVNKSIRTVERNTREESYVVSVDNVVDYCLKTIFISDPSFPLHDYYVEMCALHGTDNYCMVNQDKKCIDHIGEFGFECDMAKCLGDASYLNDSGSLGVPPGTQTDYGSNTSIVFSVYAAVFTKELYEKAKETTNRDSRPSEFVEQNYGYFNWGIPSAILRDLGDPPLTMKVRPHGEDV